MHSYLDAIIIMMLEKAAYCINYDELVHFSYNHLAADEQHLAKTNAVRYSQTSKKVTMISSS